MHFAAAIFHCLTVCLFLALATSQTMAQEAPKKDAVHRIVIGKNVMLELIGQERRVVVQAKVCLREGTLEHLLCRRTTKEHEAILAADVDARNIHAALLAAGAEPGRPAKFDPKFEPATGTSIRIHLQFDKDGKKITVPAQEWVRTIKGQKDMAGDWVFAGSRFLQDPKLKGPFYAANQGDVICVSNFADAMLDLPMRSSSAGDELLFEANTGRIPPLDTAVTVILTPVRKGK
jgi:hypothetical protein